MEPILTLKIQLHILTYDLESCVDEQERFWNQYEIIHILTIQIFNNKKFLAPINTFLKL
jgi:hypothetical protein